MNALSESWRVLTQSNSVIQNKAVSCEQRKALSNLQRSECTGFEQTGCCRP